MNGLFDSGATLWEIWKYLINDDLLNSKFDFIKYWKLWVVLSIGVEVAK